MKIDKSESHKCETNDQLISQFSQRGKNYIRTYSSKNIFNGNKKEKIEKKNFFLISLWLEKAQKKFRDKKV